jgi:hypothetical protein
LILTLFIVSRMLLWYNINNILILCKIYNLYFLGLTITCSLVLLLRSPTCSLSLYGGSLQISISSFVRTIHIIVYLPKPLEVGHLQIQWPRIKYTRWKLELLICAFMAQMPMSISLNFLKRSWIKWTNIATSWVTIRWIRHFALGIISQGKSLIAKMCFLTSSTWKVVIDVKHLWIVLTCI